MSDDVLATPLQFLKGIGPRRAADLAKGGLLTVEDLLVRFPLRYEDRSALQPMAALRPGTKATVVGRVVHCAVRDTRRRGFRIVEAVLQDETGTVQATWFNQPYLKDVLEPGLRVLLFGPVELRGHGGLQMTNADHEVLDDEEGVPIHTGRIVPVYEKVGTMTARLQRRCVFDALHRLPDEIADPVPASVRDQWALPSRAAALHATHFPPAGTSVDALNACATPAQQRLLREEAFLFQLGVLARRSVAAAESKPWPVVVTDAVRASARQALPFRLTPGQSTALREIVTDMQRPQPMNRLLQGDVGSGKTIVALLAGVVAMENGLQVAVMAPTELLAEQHAATMRRWLAETRFASAVLTSRVKGKERRATLDGIASGATTLIVGTHALVQESVQFARLGLVVIDEQHRFGVLQRATLRAKGWNPDVLVMTATPIPRTLALTVYGDLDSSVIPDRPPGRTPIQTRVLSDARRAEAYAAVAAAVAEGRQAYIVYPLVEASATSELRAATEMLETLRTQQFPTARLDLLHGRMKPAEKDDVMRRFAAGAIDILVATTVIEVGIDVPNATVMMIEHAERFGLAQLHQLRGRVGRGAHRSTCLLVHDYPLSADARERLAAMAETDDGFDLAERDLRIRGAGDVFGTRQAGMPVFRLVDLVRDRVLLESVRAEAEAWLHAQRAQTVDLTTVLQTWSTRFRLVEVG